jgi:DNA-binding transcriptional MerR regulator
MSNRSPEKIIIGEIEYLSSAYVADLVGVQVKTLAQWRWRGIGPQPYVEVGRRIYYPLDVVEEWLASKRNGS